MVLPTSPGQCTTHCDEKKGKSALLVLKLNLIYKLVTLLKYFPSDFFSVINRIQSWVSIVSLQNLPSKSFQQVNKEHFVLCTRTFEWGCRVLLWTFHCDYLKPLITPFTTRNIGSGFTFEVDRYALACISVADEMWQPSSDIRPVPPSIPQCQQCHLKSLCNQGFSRDISLWCGSKQSELQWGFPKISLKSTLKLQQALNEDPKYEYMGPVGTYLIVIQWPLVAPVNFCVQHQTVLNRLSRIITSLTALSWQFSVRCWSSISCSMPSSAWNWSSMIFENNMTWSLMNFIMGLSALFLGGKRLIIFPNAFFTLLKDILGIGRNLKFKCI